jgi:hypothetical protein
MTEERRTFPPVLPRRELIESANRPEGSSSSKAPGTLGTTRD